MGEIERKSQAGESEDQRPLPLAKQCKQGDQQISGDADCGDRNSTDHGIAAVVHDAAVPMGVDVAWLNFIGIVDLPCKR